MAVAKIYNSQTGQWEAVIVGATGDDGIVQSDTEPSNTDQLWLDTDDTAEPLAIPAGGTAGQILQKSTDGDYDTAWSNVPSHNYIINGAFDIWQRGTSFTSGANVYNADRWRVSYTNNEFTVSQSTDAPDNFQYSLKSQRAETSTTTSLVVLAQMFETAGLELAGKEVTYSFWLKAGANLSDTEIITSIDTSSATPTFVSVNNNGFFFSGSPDRQNISSSVTATTSWVRHSVTLTVPTTTNAMQIVFRQNPTGTAGGDDSFYIAGVQLEAGSVATPFKRHAPSLQGELAACKRYFQRVGLDSNNWFAAGVSHTTTKSLVPYTYPVEMRANPDITPSGSGTWKTAGASTQTGLGLISNGGESVRACTFQITGQSNTVGDSVVLTSESSAYVDIDAELL